LDCSGFDHIGADAREQLHLAYEMLSSMGLDGFAEGPLSA
jgi:hypothetical protein